MRLNAGNQMVTVPSLGGHRKDADGEDLRRNMTVNVGRTMGKGYKTMEWTGGTRNSPTKSREGRPCKGRLGAAGIEEEGR
jgi:hypothetical protein